MGNVISGGLGLQFLGEPAWRWALFVVMMTLFMWAWAGVLRHM